MNKKIKTVFIVGPTASGKTALGVRAAKRFDGEIVSADSMQIYSGIHIASAAPDDAEKEGIAHHLLEFLKLSDQFTVADYTEAAKKCISEIFLRGKLPIVVGGTGLYITSLLDNTEYVRCEVDEQLRTELEGELERVGAEEMLKRLYEFDPDSAKRLHPNNKRRIIRAFEVYMTTGKTVTEQNLLSHRNESPIEPLVIGLTYKDRQVLYERIDRRVDLMLENGLLEEARETLEHNHGKGAFQAIGHKELYGYLCGEATLSQARELLCRRTRQYAKRQLTWFRRDERVNWLYPDCDGNFGERAEALIEEFLKEE